LNRGTSEQGTIEQGTVEHGTIEQGTIEQGTVEHGIVEGRIKILSIFTILAFDNLVIGLSNFSLCFLV
jgi:hypothetical protein